MANKGERNFQRKMTKDSRILALEEDKEDDILTFENDQYQKPKGSGVVEGNENSIRVKHHFQMKRNV